MTDKSLYNALDALPQLAPDSQVAPSPPPHDWANDVAAGMARYLPEDEERAESPSLKRDAEQASSERLTQRNEEWTPFNINRRVRVKLTDKGRHYLCEEHIKFWAEVGRPMEYRAPKEDADGWSEWQLWDLMNRLGGACSMGFRIPFETTIELER